MATVKSTGKKETAEKKTIAAKPAKNVNKAPTAVKTSEQNTKPAEKKAASKASKQENVAVAGLPEMKDFPSVRNGSKETGYITLLQTNLKNRGYYDGPVDGKFGDRTEKAVMDFQKDLGKPVNGSVGPKTWEALQKSAVVKITPGPKLSAVPVQSNAGCSVLIEGLTRYQADLLIKLLSGHTECRLV